MKNIIMKNKEWLIATILTLVLGGGIIAAIKFDIRNVTVRDMKSVGEQGDRIEAQLKRMEAKLDKLTSAK